MTSPHAISLLSFLLLFSLAPPAGAYLDPGTGSLILQGAIAAIATTGFVAKLYWQRLKSFLRGEGFRSPPEDEQVGEDTEEKHPGQAPGRH